MLKKEIKLRLLLFLLPIYAAVYSLQYYSISRSAAGFLVPAMQEFIPVTFLYLAIRFSEYRKRTASVVFAVLFCAYRTTVMTAKYYPLMRSGYSPDVFFWLSLTAAVAEWILFLVYILRSNSYNGLRFSVLAGVLGTVQCLKAALILLPSGAGRDPGFVWMYVFSFLGTLILTHASMIQYWRSDRLKADTPAEADAPEAAPPEPDSAPAVNLKKN